MNANKIGTFKKLRATICNNCPLCKHARKNPESVVGKILHHKKHAENCPMWKAQLEVYGEENAPIPDEHTAAHQPIK
jgi:hypothetical protein